MNRLARSSSPYLRQHADNPVDWYPWCDEALARARAEDRPILLSVGYSACHWCHVMAHESFEDPEVAAVMNARFINIKVDREERPDIDAIYQKVVLLMGQGGGWPLTVFLTPDLRPFYGGTYFPPRPSYGRPSFRQLLDGLHDAYTTRRDEVDAQAEKFVEGIGELAAIVDEESAKIGHGQRIVGKGPLADAGRRLIDRVDPEWGGLGRQPKFPNATALELLLVMARDERGAGADAATLGPAGGALRLTLEKMWEGGIYDHLRGGFARYAVDRVWLVPHFEKMLYDNAQLLGLYAEAAALWPDFRRGRRVAAETVDYLVADMLSPEGTFYSATDADSEGVEGKYFCWTPAELAEVLGEAAGARFAAAYGVREGGNFEHGLSILHRPRPFDAIAQAHGVAEDELRAELRASRAKLLERRYTRVPPLRDDKILTAWNALLVSGLARAAAAAESWGDADAAARWRGLGERCCERLLSVHVDQTRGLEVLRTDAREGEARIRGYLDDVAYLARACLDLHELSLDGRWLRSARLLGEHALRHYSRSGGDGFFLTADDGEALIERVESQHDAAAPSGLGVIVEVLLRLEHLGAAPAGARAAVEATLLRYRSALGQPFAYASLLTAALWADAAAAKVELRAAKIEDVADLARLVRGERLGLADKVALSFVADPAQRGAVVCRGQTCSAPIADAAALRERVRGG
ncbi:MAG: thioredoxin domain-containing protein [Nannocystaceae bacterium]